MMAQALSGTAWTIVQAGNTVHVLPIDDQLRHEFSVLCPCGPVTEHVNRAWHVHHQALDGRS